MAFAPTSYRNEEAVWKQTVFSLAEEIENGRFPESGVNKSLPVCFRLCG